MDDLVRQGKVRYSGCSNFPAQNVAEACQLSGELKISGFVSCQDQYNLLAAIEQELLPAMESHALGLLPFFPLAGGMLTGKYKLAKPRPRGRDLRHGRISPCAMTQRQTGMQSMVSIESVLKGATAFWKRPSAGCFRSRLLRASSQAPPDRSRSRRTSAPPLAACLEEDVAAIESALLTAEG